MPSDLKERPPRVSVVIPCYNAAEFVAEALDSVFGQSYGDHEVIVVNDGSPDTPALERVLQAYGERIRYVQQENAGPGGARNSGILLARGEYVAFLDADDVWEAEFLEAQLALLAADPSVDLVYADAVLFGDTAQQGRTLMQTSPSDGQATFASLLQLQCTIFTSCVVARREALIDAGLFDARFHHAEDFDLWLRLALRGGRIAYQRRVLGRHRDHVASLTAVDGALIRSQVAICDKLLSTLPLNAEEERLVAARRDWCEAQLALMMGKQALLAGAYAEAWERFQKASATLGGMKLRVVAILARLAPSLLRRAYAASQRVRPLGAPQQAQGR